MVLYTTYAIALASLEFACYSGHIGMEPGTYGTVDPRFSSLGAEYHMDDESA
jgi:hypothetical protein